MGTPLGEGFIYVPTALYDSYIEHLVSVIPALGVDTATATYIATAITRKIEDYPEICG